MRKTLAILLLLMILLAGVAFSEGDLPYLLKPIDKELRVYERMSEKANPAGYIQPGAEGAVEVMAIIGSWCQVSFSTEEGDVQGYLPLRFFERATPTAEPTLTPDPEAARRVSVSNAQKGYRLNLREEPTGTARSIAKYYTGAQALLTGQTRNGFAEVEIGGTKGWMDQRYLAPTGTVVIETPLVTISNPGSGANLRSGAGTDNAILGWLPHGTDVLILGVTSSGWFHVETFSTGIVGYVSESLLSETEPFSYGFDSDSPSTGALAASDASAYINTFRTGSVLNLRKEASTSAKSLGVFHTGTPVDILSYTRTGWAFVRIGQTEGYMDSQYLVPTAPTNRGQRAWVANDYADGLNLRTMPSAGSALLAYLPNGASLTLYGELSDGWCYVQSGDMTGYVLATGLKTTK